jgi:hypothetical protein
MALVLDKPGKEQFMNIGGIRPLMASLKREKDTWVKQNALKLVSALAVLPAARQVM